MISDQIPPVAPSQRFPAALCCLKQYVLPEGFLDNPVFPSVLESALQVPVAPTQHLTIHTPHCIFPCTVRNIPLRLFRSIRSSRLDFSR